MQGLQTSRQRWLRGSGDVSGTRNQVKLVLKKQPCGSRWKTRRITGTGHTAHSTDIFSNNIGDFGGEFEIWDLTVDRKESLKNAELLSVSSFTVEFQVEHWRRLKSDRQQMRAMSLLATLQYRR